MTGLTESLSFEPALTRRFRQAELMDQQELGRREHEHALRGLARLNVLSTSLRLLWQPIYRLVDETRGGRLRILDIATGAGDLPLALWRRARRNKISLEIEAVDVSPLAVEYARRHARNAGAPIRYEVRDVLQEGIPGGYDIVTSSLFMHHLAEPQALQLLRGMAQATNRLVLVNDLVRRPLGLLLACVVPWLSTRSRIVHVDAVRSVRAAFTLGEVRRLAQAAGLQDARIEPRWPCRFLLQWQPGHPA